MVAQLLLDSATLLDGRTGFDGCAAVQGLALALKNVVFEHRVSATMLYVSFLSLLVSPQVERTTRKFASYKLLSPQSRDELGLRCMQLFVGAFIASTGYISLLFHFVSGCDTSELYVFSMGGIALMSYELYEYILRWPLHPALLVHHLAVIFVGIAVVEWKVIFTGEGNDKLGWMHVLILTSIGATWVSDFFHAIYRTSLSLEWIETCQVLFMVLALARLANIALIFAMTVKVAREGSLAGTIVTGVLTLAYTYITVKAVKFVYYFDCPKYFKEHQAKWIDGGKDAEANATRE